MEQIELVVGAQNGAICIYDPTLMDEARIWRFNQRKQSSSKTRQVEFIRWLESGSEDKNADKFIAVFSDGTFYIFYRPQNLKEGQRHPYQTDEGADEKEKIKISDLSLIHI